MITIDLKRSTDNLAQRRLLTRRRLDARADAPSRQLSIPATDTLNNSLNHQPELWLPASQLTNRLQRTRRSRAHTFRISQIPIALRSAAFSAPHPPRVLSLAAFARRPLLYVAPMSLAGIRNPQQNRKSVVEIPRRHDLINGEPPKF